MFLQTANKLMPCGLLVKIMIPHI